MGTTPLAPGSVFAGDFEVIRLLADGGMGSVYVVEQRSTGKRRALKVMHPRMLHDPTLRERFTQEARLGAKIASDHVVEVVGAGVDPQMDIPWMAMELLQGSDLSATRSLGVTSGAANISISTTWSGASSVAHFQYERPASSANPMSPSAHTSVAGVMAPPCVCSGAIQSGVPSPPSVAPVARVSCITLAMPKSRIFTVDPPPSRRDSARKRFSGLRSR